MHHHHHHLEGSVTERNLGGRGQYVRLGLGAGQEKSRNYNLSFVDPYFLGYRLSAGVDIFRSTYRADKAYDVRQTGGSLRFAVPINDQLSANLAYSYIQEEYDFGKKYDLSKETDIREGGGSTQDKTAQKALADNNKSMNDIINAFKNNGIQANDLQTSGLSIYQSNPNKDHEKKNNGIVYHVSNSLTVRIRDLSNAGKIFDQAMALGVNSVHGITFTNANTKPFYQEARKKAIAEAGGGSTQDKTAQKALADNNKSMNDIINAFKNNGIQANDLQTSGLSIYQSNPNKDHEKKNNGIVYHVSNSLTVRIRDLSNAGKIFDQAMALGVNSVHGITFTNANTKPFYQE
nr:rC3 [synthetic construct]